jgi:hypothetical protein
MSRAWLGVIAFVGGVGVGLLVAKLYASSKIQGDLDAGLAKVGLGGGAVQSFVDTTVVPTLVG